MKSICVSWIGEHDRDCFKENNSPSGPILALLNSKHSAKFDEVHLISNYPKDEIKKFLETIKKSFNNINDIYHVDLDSPMDYGGIYRSVKDILINIKKKNTGTVDWHFHTSPGTPAMTAVWILLGKTSFPATLYNSWYDKLSKEQKVDIVDLPFDLSVDYIPDLMQQPSRKILENWKEIDGFRKIVFQSDNMKKMIEKTYRISLYDVPVLILGETGTGKELTARAIHEASSRKTYDFKAVNCGALPETLIETTLFGWCKGAFTDARAEGKGLFRECDRGSLFLDEIGELSPKMQVKLLRVLQEKTVQRVGDNKEFHVDVRMISATNRDLSKMMIEGTFREDLFHRIAVGIIKLPPLKERADDIPEIARSLLEAVNKDFEKNVSPLKYQKKKLSTSALRFMKSYHWPGNVRELQNTIQRACLWTDNDTLTETDIRESLIHLEQLTKYPVVIPAQGMDLKAYLLEIEKNYAQKAIEMAGSKRKAAEILGMNPKTFEARCRNLLDL